MKKNVLELGIYIAIMSLLLGIVALVNTMILNTDRMKTQNIDKEKTQIEQLQN